MKIALVGGTGDIGTGFAVRWGKSHEIIIGSRKEERAKESASAVQEMLGGDGSIIGADNAHAVKESEIVVLCVPYEHLISVTRDLSSSYSNQLVISPVVPMSYNGTFFQFDPPGEGSAAMQIKGLLPGDAKIVSAFHTICAAALQDLGLELFSDVFLCSDDQDALNTALGLVREIKSLRPLNAGPLAASSLVESLTPMILNVSRRNRIKHAGISIIKESK